MRAPAVDGTPRARALTTGWLVVALVTLAVLVFVALLDSAVHAVVANSDSATVALEGRALAHGNLTLSGWSLSLDSFWTIDALFYAAGVAVLGFVPALNHVVPAAIALGVVLVGAAIAAGGAARRGALVAALCVTVFLTLPAHALAAFLLQGPWHVATTLWCLVAFLALGRGRTRWRYPLAALFLAGGLLGDLQTVGIGVAPVALSGLLAAARTRRWRSALGALGVAGCAVLGAVAVRALTSALGAFSFHEAHHTASLGQMTSDLGHLASWGLALLGVVRGPYDGPALPFPIEAAHLVVALGIIVGLSASLLGSLRGALAGHADPEGRFRLDDLLVLGFLGDLALFEVLTLSKNPGYARYLTPAVIFAVLLAARRAAELADRPAPPRPRRAALAVVLACTIGLAAGLAIDLHQPVPRQPVDPVDAFLLAHHLTEGIGDYWAASIVTLESRGAVTVRPVVADPAGTIVRDGRQSDVGWYRGRAFQFLVYQRAPYGRVSIATVEHTFGRPAHLYALGKYYVVVWPHLLVLPPGQYP
ncbi:MAG TPA: hypothetical protein VNF07_00380 [Acidimicrobiales bacterium]|nr:hypothetical protein [Acidimicrobiales bacterium]